ncbi:RNA 3'-terminal phosphate cyclase-like protein [Nematocida displodere]|uniref:RNA 3'-terminal phosphate cyclase-like protein n=1 Tax=Nematocida displodere TaxID=1805483 RepID=A0A177EBA7_9MICR|nr:RNA 3'-terminal phosphate cyclase-like protein [Nematocida displodere]
MEVVTAEVESAIVMSLIGKRTIKLANVDITSKLTEFIRFIKAISHSQISVSERAVEVVPGSLSGGKLAFSSETQPSSYFIYHLLPIAAYFKTPIRLTVRGSTNRTGHMSIDLVKSVYCKILADFGVVSDIKIVRRALFPCTDGEVLFLSEVGESLSPVRNDKREALSRIININYINKLSADIIIRITNLHRDTLKKITSSVKVYNDLGQKAKAAQPKEATRPEQPPAKTEPKTGPKPENPPQSNYGYGSVVIGNSKNSVYYAEYIVDGTASLLDQTPESRSAAMLDELIRSIRRSGAYDYKTQPFLFMLLPLTTPDASCLLIRRIDKRGKEVLRLAEDLLKYKYTLEKHQRTEEDVNTGVSTELLLIKSFGVGYENVHRCKG